MLKLKFLLVVLLLSYLTKAQTPWVSNIRVVGNENGILYHRFIETYDKGYLLLFSTKYYLALYKLSKNGVVQFRKMIDLNDNYPFYNLFAQDIVEDIDYGYIISGFITNNKTFQSYRLKLNSCFELDYLKFSDSNSITMYCPVVKKNNLIEVHEKRFSDTALHSPIDVHLIDKITNKKIKSIRFFDSYNHNSYIRGIKIVPDGFILTGDAYFFNSKSTSTAVWLHSYFIHVDTLLNVKKQFIFDDSTSFSTIGFDVELINDNYFVSNYFSDTLNLRRFNVEIVKISKDNTIIERFRTGKKIEKSGGGPIYKINNKLISVTSYYSDSTYDREVGQMLQFDLDSKTITTKAIDSLSSLYATGLIKTKEDNLLFVFQKKITDLFNYDYAFYKYSSNLEPDTINSLDTTNYNYQCSGKINTSMLFLTIDSMFLSSLKSNEEFKESIQLFPNPAKEFIAVNFIPSVNLATMQITIYNSVGQQIYNQKAKSFENKIDVSNFPKGIYFFQFNSDSFQTIKKVILSN
ncbi:MAG: T9SS type A sorting domain-containing protein [Bacteroidota bacterium]|nr:T9SS type A sorting domain-containing protein [Bacteroidota bacterium]